MTADGVQLRRHERSNALELAKGAHGTAVATHSARLPPTDAGAVNGHSLDLPTAVHTHRGGVDNPRSGDGTIVDLHTATRAGGSPVKDLLGNQHPGSASPDAACPRLVMSPVGQTHFSWGRHTRQRADASKAACTATSLSASPVREQHRSGGRRRARTHSGPSLSRRTKPQLMPTQQGGNGQKQSTQSVGQSQSTQVVDKRWHEYLSRAKQKQALQGRGSTAALCSSPVCISQSPCKAAYLVGVNVGGMFDALLDAAASIECVWFLLFRESQQTAVLEAWRTENVVCSGYKQTAYRHLSVYVAASCCAAMLAQLA